jgi:hypothetical protein
MTRELTTHFVAVTDLADIATATAVFAEESRPCA